MSGLASMHEVNASDLKPQPPEHLLDGRLLLATDGSASADGAAGLLAELCRRTRCRVNVLAVFEAAPMPVPRDAVRGDGRWRLSPPPRHPSRESHRAPMPSRREALSPSLA